MDWLSYRLAQLSPRERGLLVLLALVVVPLAIAFLAAAPLLQDRAAARSAVAEAEALRGWVAARVAELPPTGLAGQPDRETRAPIGLSGLEQSLVGAGLRGDVAVLANRADGGVDLEFDAVSFDRLIGWLYDTTPGWGYAIASFRIARDAPGLAAAGFVLEPTQ